MFDFFKKNKKTDTDLQKLEIQLSEDQKNQLYDEIKNIKYSIKELNEKGLNNQEEILANLHEKLGLTYFKLGETDKALETLEKSLDYKLTIGEGYKKLMSIYNSKRAEAARKGNDEGIEKYMNKMDNMRNIAKKVTLTSK